MKKSNIVLFFVSMMAICFAVVGTSSSAEASEYDLNQGATFTFNSEGEWKRIYSGVFSGTSATGFSYADYSGEIQYAHVTANTQKIQAAYVVKDRIFDFEGTYSPRESYFNGNTKIWAFNIQRVNGLTPVYKTTMAVTEGLPGGTVLHVKADRAPVPNWAALPNIDSMSKVQITGTYISIIPQ
ncbi:MULTISPECIES: hypothetical protein [unclassified Enterococcus]|uniref:hypothetical protein n=1 Tax=unclassified Enterococcus TaxID=2608891 RepID=UPI001CE1F07D|nr:MULTISPECIES: hypothetical protein [unclassified Enterococcus]MCA5011944.1 hypothetical protein [Enterococcus sp. S23]MCA5014614.1 hypothetical protein [Enterococcus sp. S22(2020)]